jgi:transcriptional regulator with GAF, ATPase, and Fis domain
MVFDVRVIMSGAARQSDQTYLSLTLVTLVRGEPEVGGDHAVHRHVGVRLRRARRPRAAVRLPGVATASYRRSRSTMRRVLRHRRNLDQAVEVDRLRELIALGPALVAEVDLQVLLNRLLETACSVTGARYAALGILDKDRRELERFVTIGVTEEQQRAIGELPRGRGVLGVLIHDPRPLRLTDVRTHPHSSGFPAEHPPMHSFLGVPIIIRGAAWGNLYLTEKRIGQFTDADEYAATTLATWAAIAVDHARLLSGAAEREGRLEDAVRRLEATQAVAVAVGAETDLSRVLE